MATRSFEQAPNRARNKFWSGLDPTGFEKGPDLLNNEALSGLNAAGTAEIGLIKVNASNLPEISAQLSLPLGLLLTNIARTTTADGLTTGAIAAGGGALQIVVVTSADANNIVTLPTPVLGLIIVMLIGANGCEVRTTSPTTIGINGGVGAAAESAMPAATTGVFICETLLNWKGFMMHTAAGTLAKVEVAAP